MELMYAVAKKGLRPPKLAHVPDSVNELMAKCFIMAARHTCALHQSPSSSLDSSPQVLSTSL